MSEQLLDVELERRIEATLTDLDFDASTTNATGPTEGPLKDLIPVFFDVETFMTPLISLKHMTLRQYLASTYMLSMAVAIGRDEPIYFKTPNGFPVGQFACMPQLFMDLAQDPRYVFVAHNAAFDIRVLRFLWKVPQPKNVWCTMEGAMGAWPELPGGYSLKNIPERLQFPGDIRKMEVDLLKITPGELEKYNILDVKVTQEIFYRQTAMIPGLEQEVALRTHQQRRFYFEVDQEKLNHLVEHLSKEAGYAAKNAEQYVTDENIRDIFNTDEGPLRSVRSRRLLGIIQEMGADFTSTSLKKISPIKLVQHPQVAALLLETSRAAKMLSHMRRSKVFTGVNQVDVELGYMRAHTGRFSSPSVGKGLNLHNIPKHDASIAKPVREIFKLPAHLCFVRADLANVEYRIEGKLTGCRTVIDMFEPDRGGNIFNDPYCMAWKSMTKQVITKKSPIRQVAKAAVLGLGFCMGGTGYAKTLLTALADKKSGVTEDVLRQIAIELQWTEPKGDRTKKIIQDLGCSSMVALAAFHIHKSFNEAHPEFSMTADWLVKAVNAVASALSRDDAQASIDTLYDATTAPDRDMIDLIIDPDVASEKSIRVKCGPWVHTVCWRRPKMRPTNFSHGPTDLKLTIIKSTKQFKPFTRQLAIENVTQAAARNALCWGIGELDKIGYSDIIHIHDEALMIVERKREPILAARDAMIKIFGPGSAHPMGWATLIKPSEISVTESMWESEDDITPPFKDDKTGKMKGGDRWGKIERNDPGCLENLP